MWKKFISLDFEGHYLNSFLKLLFFWNPLATLFFSLLGGNRAWESVLFRWEWDLSEATLVVLFGMAALKLFMVLERQWAKPSLLAAARHGTGWYLLFMACMALPGLYAAYHLMIAYLNWRYAAGESIPANIPWKYYENWILGAWALLLSFFVLISWQDLRDAVRLGQLKAEELEKERLQALLANLKDQMNPHFLFNTLNTVASLIHVDPAKAEQVVIKLSALFQEVLAASRKTYHPLKEELEFCRDYLDIEQVRFGPRLNSSIRTEKGLDAEKTWIPVLLLQPLVENSVKHGLSSRASGGRVWIGAEREESSLKIWVEDDGVGMGQSPYRGSGTALENCRKRLELAFGQQARMEILPRQGGGTRILLTLPVLNVDPSNGVEK